MSEESVHNQPDDTEIEETANDSAQERSADPRLSGLRPVSGEGGRPVSWETAPAGEPPPPSKPRLRHSTRKRLAANRRNSTRSTGPKTLAGKVRVAQNARRRGRYSQEITSYAQLIVATMQDLNEDPDRFSRLQESLMEDWKPRGATQRLLVEDLASLRWERQRLERARTALVARRVQQLELERQRHSLEVSQQISAAIPGVVLSAGLLWTQDSATKFQKILEWLESLKSAMEVGEFSGIDTLMGWIYGSNLTLRGAAIKARFEALAKSGVKAGDASDRPATWVILRRELLAEISDVSQQYQLYIREHVEVTPAMRAECLAPTIDQRWLMREMNLIDRQIERKTRLLRDLQQGSGEPQEPLDGDPSAPGGGSWRGREPKKRLLKRTDPNSIENKGRLEEQSQSKPKTKPLKNQVSLALSGSCSRFRPKSEYLPENKSVNGQRDVGATENANPLAGPEPRVVSSYWVENVAPPSRRHFPPRCRRYEQAPIVHAYTGHCTRASH